MKCFTEKQIEMLRNFERKTPTDEEMNELTNSIYGNGRFVVESQSGLICRNFYTCQIGKAGKAGLVLNDISGLYRKVLTYSELLLEDKNYFKNTAFFATEQEAKNYFKIY